METIVELEMQFLKDFLESAIKECDKEIYQPADSYYKTFVRGKKSAYKLVLETMEKSPIWYRDSL